MKHGIKKYFVFLIIFLGACNWVQEKESQIPISEHAQTMATIYNYYGDEYAALCYQAYNVATERIDEIRSELPDNKNLAVVVDIDETLLDNSPYQALTIKTDSSYPYMWNEWCNLADAKAVPGAVEFLQYADEQRFKIFYVSNRKQQYVQEYSMKNLESLGFPQITEENFLLRLENSDKQARRDQISSSGYEIVLLVGDNLGDFYSDKQIQPERREQMEMLKNEFGQRFIILPNAMYGNWPASIGVKDASTMDSLLIRMTPIFE